MKQLFVSDMDGTLLGPDSRVSAESARIITSLSRRGIPVTVATARTPATVAGLLADTETIVPAIVMTGAALWDRTTGRYLEPEFLDGALLTTVLEIFSEEGVDPFVYVLDDEDFLNVYHGTEMNVCERRFYEDRRGLSRKRFVLTDASRVSIPRPGTILIFGMGDVCRIEAAAERLRAVGGLSVSCYRDIFNRDVANIEIFGAGVSKANAIRRLAARIGAERVTVYGDNLNDLPMFEVADEAVAVANAMPEVLAKADRVIGSNAESAVAKDILALAGGE
ncbi:MAG: Cof-type HAD-IIB family hydrolase [Staphylococcus sp.]|nr:Cof-type HAD-IIB family hydrolase [Staphylococcus sp.]